MVRKWILPSLLGLSLIGAAVLAEEKDEDQAMKLSDAPQAVQDAVAKALAGHDVTGFSKEDEDGKAEYEAEYKSDSGEASITFAADGSVVETEQQVDTAKLPDEVVKAVKNAHPDAKIAKAELSTQNGKSVYEVQISEEVVVTQDGQVQKDND